MDDDSKAESQCKVCGLIALKKGGFKCGCGSEQFSYPIYLTSDRVCMVCGTHYGAITRRIYRGQDALEGRIEWKTEKVNPNEV